MTTIKKNSIQRNFFQIIACLFSLLSIQCAWGTPQNSSKTQCDAPWKVVSHTDEKGFYGSGTAKKISIPVSKKIAQARAKEEVFSLIYEKIDSIVDTCQEEDFQNSEENYSVFGPYFLQRISNNVFENSKLAKYKVCPDGSVHGVVFWPFSQIENLKTEMIASVKYEFQRIYHDPAQIEKKVGKFQKRLDRLALP